MIFSPHSSQLKSRLWWKNQAHWMANTDFIKRFDLSRFCWPPTRKWVYLSYHTFVIVIQGSRMISIVTIEFNSLQPNFVSFLLCWPLARPKGWFLTTQRLSIVFYLFCCIRGIFGLQLFFISGGDDPDEEYFFNDWQGTTSLSGPWATNAMLPCCPTIDSFLVVFSKS